MDNHPSKNDPRRPRLTESQLESRREWKSLLAGVLTDAPSQITSEILAKKMSEISRTSSSEPANYSTYQINSWRRPAPAQLQEKKNDVRVPKSRSQVRDLVEALKQLGCWSNPENKNREAQQNWLFTMLGLDPISLLDIWLSRDFLSVSLMIEYNEQANLQIVSDKNARTKFFVHLYDNGKDDSPRRALIVSMAASVGLHVRQEVEPPPSEISPEDTAALFIGFADALRQHLNQYAPSEANSIFSKIKQRLVFALVPYNEGQYRFCGLGLRCLFGAKFVNEDALADKQWYRKMRGSKLQSEFMFQQFDNLRGASFQEGPAHELRGHYTKPEQFLSWIRSLPNLRNHQGHKTLFMTLERTTTADLVFVLR